MLQQQQLPELASTYRELYQATFDANVQAGTTTPFVIPLHLVAYWVIPTLYLAIPHRDRPWLYRARWLVLASICTFNWYMVKNVTSLNFASSYAVGLVAAWTTIWNFTLLVWTRPQWDAKRVERRRITRSLSHVRNNPGLVRLSTSSCDRHPSEPGVGGPNDRTSSAPVKVDSIALKPKPNGSATIAKARGLPANGAENGNSVTKREHCTEQPPTTSERTEAENCVGGEAEGIPLEEIIIALNNHDGYLQLGPKTASGLIRLAREQEYTYYWQPYPADASFWTRLDWAFDIVSSFRLTGWNWAPSCLPPYEPPPKIGTCQLPLEYGLHRSKQGYERTLSRSRLIFSRWFLNFIPSYIILDFCATIMTTDPYFIVGPEHDYPLPAHLAPLHPVLLSLQRTMFAFVGIYVALEYVWNAGALLLALYCPLILGFRAHPWHLPSLTGSFTQVLDRGLSGFWGAWWHQTFRVGFAAPTRWLLSHGYLPPPRRSGGRGMGKLTIVTPLVGTAIAFAQSGLIHCAGSYSSVSTTHYWDPPLFFALAGLGTLLQAATSHLLRRQTEKLPRWVRRLGNLAFVFLWLWSTSWLLLDDFGRSGLWLWEPVPISLARAAGFGADRRIWRYNRHLLPKWQWGTQGRWWETGIAI
ncbi:hypothetical protein SAMD00023353_0303100 [Rosellinia necatrix]|uniref:Wax synthase domain-containing protein n=1 Tax=Rosellinia necatrix TaxID=77044 RepID=A0A1W2TDU9_ROSNE|nr:hypothetical protein SAMD00023353_0303100 [Rosellinia necatrix]